MDRSFSSSSAFVEPLFGFPKLPFQVANPPVQPPEVFLSWEIQAARDSLHIPIDDPF